MYRGLTTKNENKVVSWVNRNLGMIKKARKATRMPSMPPISYGKRSTLTACHGHKNYTYR